MRTGLSTTLVVLRCFQWASGKLKNVTMRSQSSSSVATAFGYQEWYRFRKPSRILSASLRLGAYPTARSCCFASGCSRFGSRSSTFMIL